MTQLNPQLLASCDREPVQFVGATQPFGTLLVADAATLHVHSVAENAGDFFPETELGALLGRSAREIFGAEPFSAAEFTGSFASAYGDVATYVVGGDRYFEVEPAAKIDAVTLSHRVRAALDAIEARASEGALLEETARQVRALTGYDRVMIYRFHADEHGEVVAESCGPGVDSFLGLHYPASDIPAPARRVFYDNWVRMIPTVDYEPVRLRGPRAESLYLGRTTLRSVSPIHLEYLRNMKVAASLTISIKSEGKLWGLIACHHLTPRFFDRNERAAYEMLGRFVSTALREATKVEEYEERRRLQQLLAVIGARLKDTDDIGREILHVSPSLLDLFSTEGAAAALYVNGQWETLGRVPTNDELDSLTEWLTTHPADVYATEALGAEYPPARARPDFPAGLLALSIPKTRRTYVLLFRPELVRTVRWAGRPDEKIPGADGRLHPRASFAEWSDTVRGRSAPWRPWEIDAARELRSQILGADLHRQFEKEQAARQEAERAMKSREELMAVLSHDLKNPIGSITLQAHMMERVLGQKGDTRSIELVKRILRATGSMNSLINDILHVTSLEAGQLSVEKAPTELRELARETVELLGPIAAHNQLELALDGSSRDCTAPVDRERVLQVLSNLVGNALKFTPAGGRVEIRVGRCGPEEVQFSIFDTGPGIPTEHHPFIFDRFWQANQAKRLGTGLGLAISKGIVEAHGGRIWVENREGGGTSFHFTLPVAEKEP